MYVKLAARGRKEGRSRGKYKSFDVSQWVLVRGAPTLELGPRKNRGDNLQGQQHGKGGQKKKV